MLKNSLKKIKTKLEKVKGWHLALLALVIFSGIVLFNTTPGMLTGDETFFYFQAQHMKQGEFVWFQYTLPLFFPMVLALFITKNVILLKLSSALFMALSVLILFALSKKIFNRSVAVVASLIFIFHKETMRMASLLYTEALSLLLLLLSFYLFYLISEKKGEAKWGLYVLFGIIMGLSIETRITNLLIPAFFLLYFLFTKIKEVNKKFITSLVITFTMIIPYFLVGGINFLQEKTGGLNLFQNLGNLFYFAPTYFGVIFLVMFFLAFLINPETKKMPLFYFTIYYLVFIIIISNSLFARYFFILIPVVSIFIAKQIFQRSKMRYFFLVLVIPYFIISLLALPGLPGKLSQTYFVDLPEGCVSMEKFNYSCNGGNSKQIVELPFFAQATNSHCTYETNFNAKQDYKYIYISYLDNSGSLQIDDDSEKKIDGTWVASLITKKIKSGNHILKVKVYNVQNIGGIGQILLCERNIQPEKIKPPLI